MWWQACTILLHTFPALVAQYNIMFTDECAVYLSVRSQNVYVWAKQIPHFFEEVAWQPPHIMLWAESPLNSLLDHISLLCLCAIVPLANSRT